ncbi:hypothetical protein GCM10027440_04970 [Nocardiopsis coralliicola]
MDRSQPHWKTSSYSGGQGECVEVGMSDLAPSTRMLRDSKNPHAGQIELTETEWTAFIGEVAAE